MMTSLLICPNCHLSLSADGRALKCPAGHSFDMAREGYVNLVTGKAPRAEVGDSAEMVAARRGWLGRGCYEFLAAGVRAEVAAGQPKVVADFGCGEGYYLNYVLGGLTEAAGYGTDISKAAVAAAAKAYPVAQFVVADTNKLIPLADGAVDVGMCIFAPRSAEEFARVIRSGGRLVIVIPGAEHLAALRERFGLIGIEADKANKIETQLAGHFQLIGKTELAGSARLDGAALTDLVEMTPNARHIDEATRADLVGGATADFRFEILTFTRILEGNENS